MDQSHDTSALHHDPGYEHELRGLLDAGAGHTR